MNLAKTQLLSIITKGITTALGIIQSIIIVRILSPAQFGLVGLVMSIGSVIGVSQHLGVVDGAIREIAVRTKKKDIAHIVWASHIVRQAVTIPLSLVLFFIAPIVAGKYGYPEITPYIRIFSAALVLQGLQDVWGATLTGMKRFVSLYVIQIITAAINIAVFGYLTWKFGIAGFFWAVIVTTSIMVVLLAIDSLRALSGQESIPSLKELRAVARQIIRIGAYTYIARIFFVVWQRLPLLVLGAALTTDALGHMNAALTFGARLTIIAGALSEVNLSWMSSLFVSNRQEFSAQVTKNMHRVLVFMLALTLVLLFFAPEIIQYVIGREYAPAQPLILLITAAFFLYALTDIGTSSIFVPSDNPRLRATVYGALVAVSGSLLAWVLLSHPNSLAAAGAMLVGAAIAYISTVLLAHSRFQIRLVSYQMAILLAGLAASVVWLFSYPTFGWRLAVFLCIAGYVLYEAHRQQLLPNFLKRQAADKTQQPIIYFAGGFYHQPAWTNRQHIATGLSHTHPVLYVEPRVWVIRYIIRNWRRPSVVTKFLWRLVAWERISDQLIIISQANLLPGSRESKLLSSFNHALNRWLVLGKAWWLGFLPPKTVWIYDTEAAEYLSAFPQAFVFYDCVDDHAAQAGVDRNSRRVEEEEAAILKRADVVTVTSRHLYELKKPFNSNTHLVLNAGDVETFLAITTPSSPTANPPLLRKERKYQIILGTVGALDSYKVDFDLLLAVAKKQPGWQFVFVGKPVVDRKNKTLTKLQALPNVKLLGQYPREAVPAIVHQFDVCLIPYKHSRYNRSSFPLKFWEFMATGKPIIVSGLPELKPYQPLISYVKTADEFIAAATKALANPTRGKDERIQLAKAHSWEKRIEALKRLL